MRGLAHNIEDGFPPTEHTGAAFGLDFPPAQDEATAKCRTGHFFCCGGLNGGGPEAPVRASEKSERDPEREEERRRGF